MGATWLVGLLALLAPAAEAPPAPVAAAPDAGVQIAAASRCEFLLYLRWGQTLRGICPRVGGEVEALADGRRRVRIWLDARAVEIADHPRYTAFARGPRFFDAERHPFLYFLSDPYPPQLLHAGGTLEGLLTVRGRSRRERLTLAPAACAVPGRECAIVVRGQLSRDEYGMPSWRMVLRDRVDLLLEVRTEPVP
ncbi:YceI family protein [Vulcaniibacterium gelatinicum]|uniref:YceI family protein n=1 Tax=Vulcaniibacterium gelatinicum TaxID=2598725 RepID=UPI0011C77A7D|nr:YceI family protein [Vulcaniibacterium gelatinicum]